MDDNNRNKLPTVTKMIRVKKHQAKQITIENKVYCTRVMNLIIHNVSDDKHQFS
jgi:hypothetical protein